MLEADTEAGAYWKKCGDEALKHGVKGIIIMVSNWKSQLCILFLLTPRRERIGTVLGIRLRLPQIHHPKRVLVHL